MCVRVCVCALCVWCVSVCVNKAPSRESEVVRVDWSHRDYDRMLALVIRRAHEKHAGDTKALAAQVCFSSMCVTCFCVCVFV